MLQKTDLLVLISEFELLQRQLFEILFYVQKKLHCFLVLDIT